VEENRNCQADGYELDAKQLQQEWEEQLTLARDASKSVCEIHVFTLAHVLRRPIIVYGGDVVADRQGVAAYPCRFAGIYLPMLWDDPAKCTRTPLAMAYDNEHFTALVHRSATCRDDPMLPISNPQTKALMRLHFATAEELADPAAMLGRWMDILPAADGVYGARCNMQSTPIFQELWQRYLRAAELRFQRKQQADRERAEREERQRLRDEQMAQRMQEEEVRRRRQQQLWLKEQHLDAVRRKCFNLGFIRARLAEEGGERELFLRIQAPLSPADVQFLEQAQGSYVDKRTVAHLSSNHKVVLDVRDPKQPWDAPDNLIIQEAHVRPLSEAAVDILYKDFVTPHNVSLTKFGCCFHLRPSALGLYPKLGYLVDKYPLAFQGDLEREQVSYSF